MSSRLICSVESWITEGTIGLAREEVCGFKMKIFECHQHIRRSWKWRGRVRELSNHK